AVRQQLQEAALSVKRESGPVCAEVVGQELGVRGQTPADLQLILGTRDRARRVDEHAAATELAGRGLEQLVLERRELRDRSGVLAPPHVGARLQRSEVGA